MALRIVYQPMRITHAIVSAGLCLTSACEKAPDRGVTAAPVRTEPVAAVPTVPTAVPTAVTPSPTTAVPTTPVPPKLPPPRPAISVHVDAGPARAPAVDRTVPAAAAPGALPEPPSVVPEEYQLWLRQLPKAEQQRIATFCGKHRTDFQTVCGGIGPLHIPYPPFVRARMPQPGDVTSLFASSEEWQASLSPRQLRYIDRTCVGGEMMESSDLCGDNTPLVVAFDQQPIAFTRGGTFAFHPGAPVATDWPTATTPWIALDRDGDGAITSGAELFGSDTVLPGGDEAENGFLALAALDANHDGRIDASDPAFRSLVLWADRDGDQRSAPGELQPLAQVIVSISLAHRLDLRCDARDNCEGERAMLTWRDAAGALREGTVVDVYLPRR